MIYHPAVEVDTSIVLRACSRIDTSVGDIDHYSGPDTFLRREIMLNCNLARKVAFRGVMASLLAVASTGAQADQPGRGATGPFEVDYLKFIIDHHYSALRMTELAAGTDIRRDAEISASEGTSPTPQTTETRAKAQMEEIKSMARMNNRGQREEIMTAQRFLKD